MQMRPGGIAHYCAPYLGALCLLNPALGRTAETSAAQAVHPERWPRLKPALPRDPDLESRIEALLARMTSAQKVGQLIQADIDSITPDDLAHYPLGSVLNGGNSSPHGDKLAPPGEWLALADRFYDVSLGAGASSGIPLLWGTDAVHGHNNIPGATIFPHNIGLGATRDPALIRRIGEITAREVRVTGLDWAFSPSAAVARDARWGRTYESRRTPPWCAAVSRRWWPGCRARPAAPAVRSQSAALAPTATQARSAFDTEPRLKLRTAAAMRVRACPSGIGGFVSPFFAL